MHEIRGTLKNAELMIDDGEPKVQGQLYGDTRQLLSDGQSLVIGPILGFIEPTVLVTQRDNYRVEWNSEWQWLGLG